MANPSFVFSPIQYRVFQTLDLDCHFPASFDAKQDIAVLTGEELCLRVRVLVAFAIQSRVVVAETIPRSRCTATVFVQSCAEQHLGVVH